MNILEAKNKLKTEGYTWFDLSELNEEFFNWLLKFKCNNDTNLKEKITALRADSNTFDGKSKYENIREFDDHASAVERKKELLKIAKEQSKVISQIWYYSDFNSIVNTPEEINLFQKYVKELVTYFYDFGEEQEYILFAPMFTYYDEGCELKNHSDGTGTGRVCALLIYLNEEYDENDGGLLVLNKKEKVIPTFGKVAIIDLQEFDIPHMVTKVTGGLGRFAILTFIKKKEHEFIH